MSCATGTLRLKGSRTNLGVEGDGDNDCDDDNVGDYDDEDERLFHFFDCCRTGKVHKLRSLLPRMTIDEINKLEIDLHNYNPNRRIAQVSLLLLFISLPFTYTPQSRMDIDVRLTDIRRKVGTQD